MEPNAELYQKLTALKSTLPPAILADHFHLRPDLEKAYTSHHRENYQKNVAWIISFLAESVWAGQPVLFEEFIAWLKTFQTSIKLPMKDLTESFQLIIKRLHEACSPDERAIVDPMLERAIAFFLLPEEADDLPTSGTQLTPLAKEYIAHLLQGNRNHALSLIMGRVQAGMPVKDVYLEVFQPVQYEIGRLWQTNKISVAQEHFCTGATQLVMSQLYPYLFTGEKKEMRMVTTCVSGELHEIGARMVTDFFEMDGWDTYYLGANMPVGGVIAFIRDVRPHLLAISATMTYHVKMVEEMIMQVRSAEGVPAELKIMVGGYPFKVSDELWKRVGADGFALNASDALELARNLI
jgi:MerR family transcriptional regulator, light-induced transcriptional regulator